MNLRPWIGESDRQAVSFRLVDDLLFNGSNRQGHVEMTWVSYRGTPPRSRSPGKQPPRAPHPPTPVPLASSSRQGTALGIPAYAASMPEITQSKDIAGIVVVTPDVHGDNRGRFVETFRQEWLPEGAPSMLQGNRADRKEGALVGLHYHRFQSDFWYVPTGRAMVVLHDSAGLVTDRREDADPRNR